MITKAFLFSGAILIMAGQIINKLPIYYQIGLVVLVASMYLLGRLDGIKAEKKRWKDV